MLVPNGQMEETVQLVQANVNEAANELKIGSSAAEFKSIILLKLESGQPWSFL
jgi:hypothetical protein